MSSTSTGAVAITMVISRAPGMPSDHGLMQIWANFLPQTHSSSPRPTVCLRALPPLTGRPDCPAAWQVRTVDLADRADCLRKFQSNRDFGALVLAAIVEGKWLAPPGV